jgi:hypothetical protein
MHCLAEAGADKVLFMMQRQPSNSRSSPFSAGFLLFAAAPVCVVAEPAPAAVSAFNSYISTVESRLAQQHRSQNGFLAPVASPRRARAPAPGRT